MTSNAPSLLDEILPRYDISSVYSIRIKASPDQVYAVLQQGIPSGGLSKVLMMLRSVPRLLRGKKVFMNEDPFYRLKEAKNREMVYGIIGQFWKPVVRPIPIHSLEEFLDFHKDGYCKAALNLKIQEKNEKETLLSTETRVFGYGVAGENMKKYWRLIRPFSGMIRKELLRKVKAKAER
jgi:hypothetical protein